VRGVRSRILRPTGFLDIKADQKDGRGKGSEGRISKRLLRQTEIKGGI